MIVHTCLIEDQKTEGQDVKKEDQEVAAKNLFVVCVDNYQPDLCVWTIPTLKNYADKIGAKFNLITERKFPDWPPSYEKMQVHELGKHAHWNILVDADFLLHPDLPDFTTMLDPTAIGVHYGFAANQYFKPNKYFIRDGRNQGLAGNFIMTSSLTHDLWTPLEISKEDALSQFKNPMQVDEFTLSRNLAKFGLKFSGVEFNKQIAEMMIHVGNQNKSDEQIAQSISLAKHKHLVWLRGAHEISSSNTQAQQNA